MTGLFPSLDHCFPNLLKKLRGKLLTAGPATLAIWGQKMAVSVPHKTLVLALALGAHLMFSV